MSICTKPEIYLPPPFNNYEDNNDNDNSNDNINDNNDDNDNSNNDDDNDITEHSVCWGGDDDNNNNDNDFNNDNDDDNGDDDRTRKYHGKSRLRREIQRFRLLVWLTVQGVW